MDGELVGFTVVKGPKYGYPRETIAMSLSVSNRRIRFSAKAIKILGEPDYINFFIDEMHKRVMVKAAEKSFANRYALNVTNNTYKNSVCSKSLAEKMADLFGTKKIIEGYAPDGTKKTLIFVVK